MLGKEKHYVHSSFCLYTSWAVCLECSPPCLVNSSWPLRSGSNARLRVKFSTHTSITTPYIPSTLCPQMLHSYSCLGTSNAKCLYSHCFLVGSFHYLAVVCLKAQGHILCTFESLIPSTVPEHSRHPSITPPTNTSPKVFIKLAGACCDTPLCSVFEQLNSGVSKARCMKTKTMFVSLTPELW